MGGTSAFFAKRIGTAFGSREEGATFSIYFRGTILAIRVFSSAKNPVISGARKESHIACNYKARKNSVSESVSVSHES